MIRHVLKVNKNKCATLVYRARVCHSERNCIVLAQILKFPSILSTIIEKLANVAYTHFYYALYFKYIHL